MAPGDAGIESTAWTSYHQVRKQSGERANNDLDLPQAILDPSERVLDVVVADTSSDDDPELIATDRRVILAQRPAFRRWRVVREAPGSEVVGASYTKTFLAGRLSVHLRDGSSIDLRSRHPEKAERFVATIQGLLGR